MVKHNAMIIAEHEVPNDRRTDQYRFESCIARGTNQKADFSKVFRGEKKKEKKSERNAQAKPSTMKTRKKRKKSENEWKAYEKRDRRV